MDEVVDWARLYAGMGWRVLPIAPGAKRPPMTGWQHAATCELEVIGNWWGGLYRGYGIGIATGQQSGVWVLDIDPAHGGDDALAALEAEHGKLPDTATVETGGGGRHYFWLNPQGLEVRTRRDVLAVGIDVRGDGGQVVAPPSTHASGRTYTWLRAPWMTAVAQVAMAPDWLLALVTAPLHEPIRLPDQGIPLPHVEHEDSIAAWINEVHDWQQVLPADGWTFAGQNGADTQWTRPGKDVRQGISAVLHPNGVFVNWSTSLPALTRPENATGNGTWSFSMFGYLAATRFGGDRSALASQARRQRNADELRTWTQVTAPSAAQIIDGNPPVVAGLAHWAEHGAVFSGEHGDQEFVVPPLVPAGRTVAVYAPAKEGKSEVVFSAVAAYATGRSVWGQSADSVCHHIAYLDWEMTEADYRQRLDDLGYTVADVEVLDTYLHYGLVPSFDPLDTERGARQLLDEIAPFGVELVVIDTFTRAVVGEDNSVDTVRNFYRHTGSLLKAHGIAVVRIDHAGKVVEAGQRGSSAKNDDVDVVWRLARMEGGATLTRTHSRISWVPERVDLRRTEGDDRIVYTWSNDETKLYPAGTAEVAALLDKAQVPLDVGLSAAQVMVGRRRSVVSAALRYRREQAERGGIPDAF